MLNLSRHEPRTRQGKREEQPDFFRDHPTIAYPILAGILVTITLICIILLLRHSGYLRRRKPQLGPIRQNQQYEVPVAHQSRTGSPSSFSARHTPSPASGTSNSTLTVGSSTAAKMDRPADVRGSKKITKSPPLTTPLLAERPSRSSSRVQAPSLEERGGSSRGIGVRTIENTSTTSSPVLAETPSRTSSRVPSKQDLRQIQLDWEKERLARDSVPVSNSLNRSSPTVTQPHGPSTPSPPPPTFEPLAPLDTTTLTSLKRAQFQKHQHSPSSPSSLRNITLPEPSATAAAAGVAAGTAPPTPSRTQSTPPSATPSIDFSRPTSYYRSNSADGIAAPSAAPRAAVGDPLSAHPLLPAFPSGTPYSASTSPTASIPEPSVSRGAAEES